MKHTEETKRKISLNRKLRIDDHGQYFICDCPEMWIIHNDYRCKHCGKTKPTSWDRR